MRVHSNRSDDAMTRVSFLLKSRRRAISLTVALILALLYFRHVDIDNLLQLQPTNTSSIATTTTHQSNEYLSIYKLQPSFINEPSHLTPIDQSTLILQGNQPIDSAHRNGYLHTGACLFVMDSAGRFLFLKRSPSVVTCPDTWSILGEHSNVGEEAKDVPVRALEEELGLVVSVNDNGDDVSTGKGVNDERIAVTIQTLTDNPLYYIRHYGARNDNRIDRQLTYLLLVKLPRRQEDIKWKLDNEVANHKWITLSEMETWLKGDSKYDEPIGQWKETSDDGPANGEFCHRTIRTLYQLGVDRLKQIV